MFLVVKKGYIIIAAIILFAGAALFFMLPKDVAATVAPGDKLVIIDPGHGGEDGGAEGQSGVLEKIINLQIALKIRNKLEGEGVTCLLTRDSDISIHDNDKSSIRSKKVSDLKNRRQIIEKSGAALFISVHMNKFEQSQYWGSQVFYSARNEQSKLFAEQTRQSLLEVLQDDNKREVQKAGDSIYLLKYTTMPAILVECGFLSNPEEESRLKTDNYQEKLADAIAQSAKTWIDNN